MPAFASSRTVLSVAPSQRASTGPETLPVMLLPEHFRIVPSFRNSS